MKKLSTLMLAVAAMAALACNESDVKKYAISGTGLEDGTQVLLVDQMSGEAIDTAVVANGAFAFKGTAPKDAYLNITADGADWNFMLFNDGKPLKVNYADNSLQGSALNNKLQEYDQKTSAMMTEYNDFVNALVALPREEQQAKMPEYEEWYKKLGECYTGVVEENMDNIIPVAFIRNVRSLAGPDKFNELLESGAPFAQHPYVLDLKRKIEESAAKQKAAEEKKQAIIGQKFLDLEEPDTDGKMHKLSEYVGQGKWVLVDFWEMLRVSIFRPPLAAAYAETVSRPSSDIIEQMLMILPSRRSIISGRTAEATMNGATRSTSMTAWNSERFISCIGMRLMMPALFTRMSIWPTSSWIFSTRAFTSSSLVTSHTYPCTFVMPASL